MNKLGCLFLLSLLTLSACDPITDRAELSTDFQAEDLKYSVTQKKGQDNVVYLSSETPGVIVYWDYEIGTSNQEQDTISIPFAGDYTITYTAYPGGMPVADSTEITVSQNDPSYFSEPEWNYLTNGVAGKTWVLNMERPVGWYGLDYGEGGSGDWVYHPSYEGNEWVMENKDWGQMTFNLDGDYNYSRTMYDKNGNPVTCEGTFTMDLEAEFIHLQGCDMLYGGNYYNQVSNWRKLKILKIMDKTLILGVLRDQSTEGEAWIGFQFKEAS